jgi:ankyrin repeat protein
MDKTARSNSTGNFQVNDNQQPSDTPPASEKHIAVGVQADSGTNLLATSNSSGIKATATAPTYAASASNSASTHQQQFFNAVASKDLSEVTRLLTAHPSQIDIKLTDKATGKSPLKMALEAKNDKLAQALVFHGAPANAFDGQGRTPVMLAAAAGLTHTVNMLTSRGATIDDVDKSGCTALHHAVQGGKADIVTALIHAKANVNATEGRDALLCITLLRQEAPGW